MGLDMYLRKYIWVGRQYEHVRKTTTLSINYQSDGETVPIDVDKVATIVEHIYSWRKMDDLHNWFVVNVQGGEDDCKEYDITADDFEELKLWVKKQLAKMPEKIQEYTDLYWDRMVYTDTIKVIDNALAEIEADEKGLIWYSYSSSW